MFYSHEILTSRKYGVATVWLVATLGAKSTTKKVTRKAILEVNVKKACTTIMEPEAPMALRLQSNLLYGVSRVYSQQCGYVLGDAQRAQESLRALLKTARGNGLDVDAGRVRPDQLILEDDPAFMPDMALPALDFDFTSLQLDMAEYKESQQSMLSPHERARSGSSVSVRSPIDLDIQSSGIGSYHLLPNEAFQVSSAQKTTVGRLFEDEEQLILDDLDFEFDAEGKIRDIDLDEREMLRTGSAAPQFGRLETDSAASDRVRREHDGVLTARPQGPDFDADGDFIMQFDDYQHFLPEADPFSREVAARSFRREIDLSASPRVETSSDNTEAQLRAPRKRRVAKTIGFDQQVELRNDDLIKWHKEYLSNMEAAKQQKDKRAATAQAKVNAKAWTFGNGLGNVGKGVGRAHLPSPLDVFTGDDLIAAITGVAPDSQIPKRRRMENEGDEEVRRVRPRPNVDENNIGLNFEIEDDFMMNQFDDINPELGRDAQAGLEDHPSSAMPWNVSASLHSFRAHGPGSVSTHGRNFPDSIGGRGSFILGGRPGSRLTSASPLLGRGSAFLGGPVPDIERLNEGVNDNFQAALGGFSSSCGPAGGRGRTLTPSRDLATAEEYELFGPAAAIDTQTAGQSQWVKEALAREALNFFEFVKNTIIEAATDVGNDAEMAGLSQEIRGNEVGFEALFPPESNTALVAAQAFHHILTLASKRMLGVHQGEMWGDIVIRVI